MDGYVIYLRIVFFINGNFSEIDVVMKFYYMFQKVLFVFQYFYVYFIMNLNIKKYL